MSMIATQIPKNLDKTEAMVQAEEEEEEPEGEEEEDPIDEWTMKKFIAFFELTRRDYINLFQKVITNQPEMLDKIFLKLLQIIMAKENMIEEYLGEIDSELGENAIKEYFLDPYAYENKGRLLSKYS